MTLAPSTASPGLWVNPAWKSGTPGTFAVVVGASRYEHLAGGHGALATDNFGLTQLSASALSAYRFFEWLRGDYANAASPIAMCWLLLSPSDAERSVEPGIAENVAAPTLPNLQRAVGEWFTAMKQLPSSAAKDSRSIFWFSGHGFDVGSEHLLLPSDYLEPPLSMPDRAVSARRLVAAMEALETRDQLFFLDTGREQLQQLQTFGITGMPLLPVPIARTGPVDRMSVTLGASMPSGRAFQPGNPKDGISFFAQAVIEGLRGEGGLKPDCSVSPCVVRLFPFVSFVQSRVQQVLSEYNVTGQAVRLQLEGSSHDVVLTQVPAPVAQTAQAQTSANEASLETQTVLAATPTVDAAPTYMVAATAAIVTQGATGTSTITITRTAGFAGNVALAAEGLPTGVTAAFTPNNTNTNGSVLTLTAAANAAVGTSTITVRGTATGQTDKTTTVQLTVSAAGGGASFSVAAGEAKLDNAYALLIGVGGASEKDTALIRDVLVDQRYGGYGENRVRRIVGSEANREGIVAALQELAWITAPGERILIYCSNPGTQVPASKGPDALESAIVPADYEEGGFVPASELERLLDALSGRSVLFLADYAHAARGLRMGAGHVAIAVGAEGMALEDSNATADTASGRYARQLTTGLRGGAAGLDGTISSLDLFEYMSTRLWNDEDRVVLVGDTAADFVIASGSSPDSPAAPAYDDDFQYDVYVSAADRDATTLHSRVLPRLIQAGLRIAILPAIDTKRGDTDQRAGVRHVATAERGIARSRRTLALLSEVYVRTVARTLGSVFDRALGAGEGRDRLLGARLGRWATARALADMRLPSVLGDPAQWVSVKNALDLLVGDTTNEPDADDRTDAEPSTDTEPGSYALVIGIDTYQKSMALRGCAQDAKLIAELLSNGGPGSSAYDVRLLTDGDATREGILSALHEVAEKATSDSTVLIFFAGHGADAGDAGASAIEPTESALVAVDYTEADPRLVTTADLEAVLADMSARHIVALADASYANRIMRGGTGRVLVSAGREGEVAYESRDRDASGVGEFSSAVIDGIRGGASSADGLVRVLDLYEFVHRRVVAKGLQHPYVGGDLSTNVAVAVSPNEMPRDPAAGADGYRYDAYLSFVGDDASLVWNELAPRLATLGLRIAVSHDLEDARFYRVATPERGITQARRSIVVVSAKSLAESTAEFERLAVATIGLDGAAARTLRITTSDDLAQQIRIEPPVREWLRQAPGWTLGALLERDEQLTDLVDRLRAPIEPAAAPATIFISYSRHDKTAADRLAAALRGVGYNVWLDQELNAGETFQATLERMIAECTIFIPILSITSLGRQTGYYLAEWNLALERGRRSPESRFIIPVAIDDVTPTSFSEAVPRELAAIQWSRLPNGEASSRWLAMIAELVQRTRAPADTPSESGDASAHTIPRELLPRLSSSSRRALLSAEGYRRAGNAAVVDTGHLLGGLYEKPEGWAHAVMQAADFDGSWAGLFTVGLGEGLHSSGAARAPSSALETMRISRAVLAALTEAGRLADENRATTIQARYLLAGLLGVSNEPAAVWMADRVELDVEALRRLILAAVEGSPPLDDVRRLRRRGARLVLAPDQARAGAPVYAAAFSPDGALLATAHYDGGVRLWNPADGTLMRLLGATGEEGHGWVNCLAWSPNGDALVWGTQDGSILFWDARTDAVGTIPGVHDGQVVSIRVSPDGRLLVSTGGDSSVQIRDWTDREMLGHGAGVYPVQRGISGIEFDVDRGLVFVASPDGSVTRLPPSAPGWA